MIVSYIKPFSTSKKIGEAYNKQVSYCSTEYVCVMDYDAMILTPITFNVIEKAIERYPDTALFGCMTNRIAYSHQRLLPLPDENDSIRHHTKIAIEQAEKYPNGECKDTKSVAGFFMLFKKSYWEKNHFQENIFDERNNLFDYQFCRYAVKNKMPIRVIQGAYLFHGYRILKESYKDMTHLRCFIDQKIAI